MAKSRAADEAHVRQLINKLAEAIRAMDFEGLRGIGPWVRYTAGFRKIDGNWLIAHDQVSVPADFGSGRALLNLEP